MPVTGTIVDMHCHTTNGASDSSLTPDELIEVAQSIGLTGVNVSEHDRVWDRHLVAEFRLRSRLFVCPGMEVSTDLGHVIAIGLSEYLPGIRRASELRKALDRVGGYMIAAHPFRRWFDPHPPPGRSKLPLRTAVEDAAQLEVLQLVDAIEVLNGANTSRENYLALEVANYLGKPGTAGSDAHSRSGVGIYATVFGQELTTIEQMLEQLHAGAFWPALGLPEGNLRRYEENSTIDSAVELLER